MAALRYTQEMLSEAVANSFSITETLRFMNMCHSGGASKIINKYVKLWDIDVSHFDTHRNQRMNGVAYRAIRPLDEILVEHSTYSRHSLKKRLYQTGLKSPICEICGQDEYWNGKRLALILDHVNGVNDDNRLENLRIVCPNCGATLDTHCGKKRPEDRSARPKHTTPSGEKSNEWRHQPRPQTRKVERPSLSQILTDISSLGYCGTGRKYGVSDQAIRKWIIWENGAGSVAGL